MRHSKTLHAHEPRDLRKRIYGFVHLGTARRPTASDAALGLLRGRSPRDRLGLVLHGGRQLRAIGEVGDEQRLHACAPSTRGGWVRLELHQSQPHRTRVQ